MRGVAFNIVTLPPSLLSKRAHNEIQSDVFQNMVTAFARIYDLFDLRNAFWSYWYAAAAPVHAAAVHYGAAIESLQQKYAVVNAETFKSTVLDPDEWKRLSAQIEELVAEQDLGAAAVELLKRKIPTLNYVPQAVIMDRFLSALRLDIGKTERSAWGKRNRAAHGSKISEEKFIEVIRDNKVLMILLNRILLALAGAADNYRDYYTLGHPVAPLQASLPLNN